MFAETASFPLIYSIKVTVTNNVARKKLMNFLKILLFLSTIKAFSIKCIKLQSDIRRKQLSGSPTHTLLNLKKTYACECSSYGCSTRTVRPRRPSMRRAGMRYGFRYWSTVFHKQSEDENGRYSTLRYHNCLLWLNLFLLYLYNVFVWLSFLLPL